MAKQLLISLLFFVTCFAHAQYFSPEAYIIHNLDAEMRRAHPETEEPALREKTIIDNGGEYRNIDEQKADSTGSSQKLYSLLIKATNATSERNYKIALEYAMTAERLAQKENNIKGWEYAQLIETSIYCRLQAYKNVFLHQIKNPSTPEMACQMNYLWAFAYLKSADYESCLELCRQTRAANQISRYDLLQLLKLQGIALEKQNFFKEALNVATSSDSLAGVIKENGYENSLNPKLYYNTITLLNFNEKINLEQLIAKNNQGFLLLKSGEHSAAEASFRQAIKMARSNNLNQFTLQVAKNLALNYTLMRQYGKAEESYLEAERLADNEKNTTLKAEILCLRGKNMYLSNHLFQATDLCRKSVEVAEANMNYMQLSQTYAVLAEINAYVGDIQKSNFYSKLSEENADKARIELSKSNPEEQANKIREEAAYDVFATEKAELEMIQLKLEATRRYQELEIIKRESQIKESNLVAEKLESEKAQQALVMVQRELQTLAQLKELEEIKRDRAISILEIKNNQNKIRLLNKQRKLDSQIKKQRERDVQLAKTRERNLRIFLVIALLILSLIGFLLYRNVRSARVIKAANLKLEELTTNLQTTNNALENTLEEVNAKNEIIELKNSQILESITYAKRIQEASLPKTDEIDAVSADNFVLNKPKDIISGDFYLVSEAVTAAGGKQLIYIVGDCTGHGVPGAMLSLLCSNLVRQSIKPNGDNRPAQLLNEVNDRLRNFFRNKTDDSFKDGMDIACCVLDKSTGKLYFSGAGRPLLLVRQNEVFEYKGERHHIGFSSSHFEFTDTEIEVKNGDGVYLFSDGFTDQFNGVTRKRFMTKNLKDILVAANGESMKRQAELLDKAFMDWKGDYMQMDDVCVLGIRI